MEDDSIVNLYWARSENAISETSKKYGNYCYSIAYNILGNVEDADESVNDTYLDAWNNIPPHRPSILSTFLGKSRGEYLLTNGVAKLRKSGAAEKSCWYLMNCLTVFRLTKA